MAMHYSNEQIRKGAVLPCREPREGWTEQISMQKIVFDLIIFALAFLFIGCTPNNGERDGRTGSEVAAIVETGVPGPVTFEVACDVTNDFTWIANDYDETVIAITDILYELGDPGKATLTITPVAPGNTTALFVYCQHGMVEANVKGFAEYEISVDENLVVSYEQVNIKFESRYDPGRLADAGSRPAEGDDIPGAVYEDVGGIAEYEELE